MFEGPDGDVESEVSVMAGEAKFGRLTLLLNALLSDMLALTFAVVRSSRSGNPDVAPSHQPGSYCGQDMEDPPCHLACPISSS
jgi:hypothetical protein